MATMISGITAGISENIFEHRDITKKMLTNSEFCVIIITAISMLSEVRNEGTA